MDGELNTLEPRPLTMRVKKYQFPAAISVKVIVNGVFGSYGLPSDAMAEVPAKILCAVVGLAYAEYQHST